jgi:hypothetical protein
MSKINSQLDRMKAMMTYGLQNESKKSVYDSVEYQREGADGKLYGIVREGTKFYIKVSDKTKGALKEDFNYIGGFRNRKDNEYTSYANALKQFDIKMISLKEAKGNTKLMVESWNPENNEKLMVEATASMQREIARQRQIMGNAATIFESKNTNYSVNLINEEKPQTGDAKKADKLFSENPKDGEDLEVSNFEKPNIGKPEEPKLGKTKKTTVENVVKESEQVLGWNDNADYLDTSHGTEVGDDAPFTEGEGTEKEMKNGTVAEGVAMHTQGDNQNSPAVGTGEIGKSVVMSIGSNELIVGSKVETMDAKPMIQNNRTFVPFRALAEAFGATVAYDQATSSVTAELNGVKVVMTVGAPVYTVNGVEKTADVAPFISDSRTFVPVRFAAEAFGITVTPTYNADGSVADVLFNM